MVMGALAAVGLEAVVRVGSSFIGGVFGRFDLATLNLRAVARLLTDMLGSCLCACWMGLGFGCVFPLSLAIRY